MNSLNLAPGSLGMISQTLFFQKLEILGTNIWIIELLKKDNSSIAKTNARFVATLPSPAGVWQCRIAAEAPARRGEKSVVIKVLKS